MVERNLAKVDVVSSNLIARFPLLARIAQLEERIRDMDEAASASLASGIARWCNDSQVNDRSPNLRGRPKDFT